MKYTHIRVNTPRGQFDIPALPIAKERADYYAVEVDGNEEGSEEYMAEVEYAMSDHYELIDWALNNSNWIDWAGSAEKVSDRVLVTDTDFWTSSDDFKMISK